MDTRTVALRLVELTSTGQDAKALDELYADDIVSIEVMSDPEADAQVWEGIDAVREKHAWWDGVATVHSVEVDGPFAGSGSEHVREGVSCWGSEPLYSTRCPLHLPSVCYVIPAATGAVVRCPPMS